MMKKQEDTRRRLIGIAVVAAFAVAATLLTQVLPARDNDLVIVRSSSELVQSESETTSTELQTGLQDPIPVYLVGAVKNPGIYLVERHSYLYELIRQAGGLLETAAQDTINLAMSLDQNQLIRIPTRQEVDEDPGLAGLGNDSNQPALIDINTADQTLLEELPGIGPATAQAIIGHRNENGPFQCTEDLMKVPGIKESRFNAIRDLIRVTG